MISLGFSVKFSAVSLFEAIQLRQNEDAAEINFFRAKLCHVFVNRSDVAVMHRMRRQSGFSRCSQKTRCRLTKFIHPFVLQIFNVFPGSINLLATVL
jgi:hypothetical protein